MNGQGNSRRLLLAADFRDAATSKAARNSQTEAEAEETTDVVAEKDSDLESGSEEPLTEKPFTPKQWPKRLAKVYDAPQSITFHDMADNCRDQVLQPIYHKLQYELPVPMNQKYQHLSLKMRAKLHGDYLSSINNAIADLAKNSYQMAPQPKPILSSSHCKSSLLKDASTFEEPTVDQSDSPPREDVQRELYVSRSGRHIQRKIYTEDSDGDSEFGSELNISKKNKTDTYDIKITLETPVVTSDSSSKPKDDQKISRLKRPYPGTPKRSLLTMKKTRSEIMFDNLAKDSKKQEQHEAEMEAFQKTLRQEDEIEVDSLSRAWNEEDDANFVPRRVPPPIPRKKPKKSQSKQTAADLDAIVPASPKPGPRSRTIKRPEVAKKRKTPPVESTPESVNCPICGRSFPMDKVQEHASACSDFAMDTEPSQTAIQSTVDTTCELCDQSFLTQEEYLIHAKQCIAGNINSW